LKKGQDKNRLPEHPFNAKHEGDDQPVYPATGVKEGMDQFELSMYETALTSKEETPA
jgi:hypothetical protein